VTINLTQICLTDCLTVYSQFSNDPVNKLLEARVDANKAALTCEIKLK